MQRYDFSPYFLWFFLLLSCCKYSFVSVWQRNNSNGYGSMEHCLTSALGKPERIIAYNTYQVKNYDRFELAGFSIAAGPHDNRRI